VDVDGSWPGLATVIPVIALRRIAWPPARSGGVSLIPQNTRFRRTGKTFSGSGTAGRPRAKPTILLKLGPFWSIGTVLAFYAVVLEHTLSEEERSQILQTIEMFEVITQTQKDDYQSLEILKVAYQKLGKSDESLRISRRLAGAYQNVGSFSLALQECEAVLAVEPDAPEILAMAGEIENRLVQSGQGGVQNAADHGLIEAPNQFKKHSDGATLVELDGRGSGRRRKTISLQSTEQANEQLAKFLIVQQMFAEDQVTAELAAVKAADKGTRGQMLAASLVDRLSKGDEEKSERILSALIDRTKFAYVPLEYYDVDRQVVRMLPDSLTIHRLFVPFDLISRTIMVAVANPFDAAAREAVEQSLDYTVVWYLAKPATIIKTLQDVYRLESRA
jgi:hypothetical protein